MSTKSAVGLTIVSASAGSGKTYRLTEAVTAAVDPTKPGAVPLEGLVAVTYTKKAHAELEARIRQKLVGAGAFDAAMNLPLAYLGTVHAACLRLLQEFALDAGLSPTVNVVASDQGALLRQALEHSVTHDQKTRLDALAARFQLEWQPLISRYDWTRPVADIMDLARGNRIAPDALPAMAKRSADGLLALLPLPEKDGAALDAELEKALAKTVKALAGHEDGTKKTEAAAAEIREVHKRATYGELAWADWAKLAKLDVGKASKRLVEPLQQVAERYERHPRLHAEIRELTERVFEAARTGLTGYQAWKKERRAVDYVDMLDGALDLLENPRVREELASRLEFVVVDEFQDTSPIQLALFVELHKLAKRSTWVGDRKQCIFEYAGADPLLMDAVAAWVAKEGGTRETLGTNYRSRKELVEMCSELFVHALAPHGFVREEVAVAAKRDALEGLPPVGVWHLESKNATDDAASIAEGVRRMLAAPGETRVLDRTTGERRDVRAGDVAVLVATNAEARAIADALHARGIRSALARAGLLGTPEGTLGDAALRWLVDEGDTLAAATLDAVMGFGGRSADAWLADKLRGEAQGEWQAALGRVRAKLGILSPSEALDEALAALDAVTLCARWPDPAQRVANLDALRALAADYEGRCEQDHEAATIAGLLRHFDDMRRETLRRDEMIASDDQHVPADEGAVIVSTYHRSKGLEWPVVVLGSLGRKERRHAFHVSPESEGEGFDPAKPLAGRWVRFWPWAFGQTTKLPLREAAEASAVGQGVAAREEKERARLLYVGFTRARDHLVMAVRGKPVWLEGLASGEGEAIVGLPGEAADGEVARVTVARAEGKPLEVNARLWRVGPVAAVREEVAEARRWFVRGAVVDAPRYWISPSNAAVDWPEVALSGVGEVVALPGAMVLDGKVAESGAFGDAVHAFFAADAEGLTAGVRLEVARRIVAPAGLTGVVRAEVLVEAGDRLRDFVEARWPGARWHREVAVDAVVDERRVSGVADLVLETDAGLVLFDHKTFDGKGEGAWRKKASEWLPQLGAYADILRRTAGKRVVGCWVHLPVGGGVVEGRPG